VKFWVVSADAKGTWSHENTHRIKVVLDPYDLETGGPLRVVDSRNLPE
jgi:hypothetical protein